MRVFVRLYLFLLFGTFVLSGCDLQPKIASIPDDIGAFISDRYPALLADPVTQPEIYNSAVTDYGVYASPELYGSSNIDDYVLYASIDDYVLAPESEKVEETADEKNNDAISENADDIIDDTDSDESNSVDEEDTDEEIIDVPEYLSVPEYKFVPDAESETKQPEISDFVIVARGDTLYSIARKNNTTVAELAKINSLREPYTLSIGQKINLRSATLDTQTEKVVAKEVTSAKVEQPVQTKKTAVKEVAPKSKNESVEKPVEKKITPARKVEKEISKPVAQSASVKRVDLMDITVASGDTLYSLSRKYQIPVNDLAVLNKLSSPFILSVGQSLKVPKLDDSQIRSAKEIKQIKTERKTTTVVAKDKPVSNVKKSVESKQPEKSVDKKTVNQKKDSTRKTDKKTTTASKKTESKKTNQVDKKSKVSTTTQSPKISARSSSKFSWPVRGKILSQYGAKNKGLFNDGINISAPVGTAVRAAENGVVAYAGNEVKGMGNLIIIQHSDGWMTVYAHLDSMSVRRGSKVSVGQQIGKIGKTGKVDKPQLHFEIRKGTKAYNPITYLKK